jgi:sterol desaturase/sphingolipid hydroxylase (fatty acid hydroxylase superfamily)
MRALFLAVPVYVDVLGSSLLLSLIFFGLERFAPAEKDQPLRRLIVNLAYYPLILAWVLLLQQALFAPAYDYILRQAGGGLLPALVGHPGGAGSRIAAALLFAVVWDVWQYWVHRWQHASAFLWQTHQLHHSETALNFSAQARHHALNYVVFMLLYVPVLLLFGSFAPPALAVFLMFRLWGYVNHANLRLSFRFLTPVIAGPQWHRIHHSASPEHHDKNFATFFPLIDVVFGTYHRPAAGEYPSTGIPGQSDSDLRLATIAPLLEWKRLLAEKASKP